jgi:hypothetical protein
MSAASRFGTDSRCERSRVSTAEPRIERDARGEFTMQLTERIAVGALASLIGGFLVAVALGTSPERAFLIWLLTVVCSGLVVGSMETSSAWDVNRAALPALVLSLTPVLYFYFLAVVEFIKNPHAVIEVIWQKIPVNPFEPRMIGGLLVLWVACFLGSFAFIRLSMVASRLILAGAQKFYKFGPEGLNRVKLVVLGIAAVLAAVLSLLSVIGK